MEIICFGENGKRGFILLYWRSFSVVVYLFGFAIAMTYWVIDELLEKKSYNRVESVTM
ncbi:hypothetical protein FHS45_000657 [Thalassobacillus devorans]|uniref:hypothetical protein n=1 Tax=Thalassobacillus devorans TaxID=279813 RepID=UPI0012F7EF46|nr:hypothetical protein [Thalassobacillus devorans]NIK27566.1 hypothetical protein [Thalassobacillus devorans]